MARIIDLNTHSDDRGRLTVVEKELGFPIARVFYIHNAVGVRGGHGHFKTLMGLIAVSGSCRILVRRVGCEELSYELHRPDQVLLLETGEWHEMFDFSPDAILLVLASREYDKSDYFYERP